EGIRVAAPPGEEGQDMLAGALAAGAGAPVPDRPARELDRDAVRRATAALPPAGEPRSSVFTAQVGESVRHRQLLGLRERAGASSERGKRIQGHRAGFTGRRPGLTTGSLS